MQNYLNILIIKYKLFVNDDSVTYALHSTRKTHEKIIIQI